MAASKTRPTKQLTKSTMAVDDVGEFVGEFASNDEKEQQIQDKIGTNSLASSSASAHCKVYLKTEQTIRKMIYSLSLFTVILIGACGDKPSIGQRATALKVTVAIPDLVGLYEGFWLNCSHNSPIFNKTPQNLNAPTTTTTTTTTTAQNNDIQSNKHQPAEQQQERIYSIRWYKDNDEFYRFVPSGEPRALHLEAKGVQADKAKTSEGNVFLVKADLSTEGTYRCEILSEGTFETVSKSKHLRVFALPVKPPRIEILDSNGRLKNPHAQEVAYEVGDKIELRCNSAPSKPAARLRWYLNDREVTSSPFRPLSSTAAHKPAVGPNYTLSVSPIEYRQHYQTIKSSHSTLSLLLDREDLVYSRLSFKCLAVIRQEISLASKQLILLTSQLTAGSEVTANNGPKSAMFESVIERRNGGRQQSSSFAATRPASGFEMGDQKVFEQAENGPNQMMYIYEDSDTTLGPSITDNPDLLAAHLRAYNYGQEANKQGENLNYIQQLRDRLARQRSLPNDHQHQTKHRQHYGHYNIVRSPFYPDELDSFRPVINWPPLHSGKLALRIPERAIVAIPTRPNVVTREEQAVDNVFEPPSNSNLLSWSEGDLDDHKNSSLSRTLLGRLIESLNCTCSETNLDTKLKWTINGRDLSELDVRFYPTRVAPDHRQTWMTIGMSPVGLQGDKSNDNYNYHNAKSSNSLSSILWQNYRLIDAQANRLAQSQAAALRSRPSGGGQQVPVGNDQLKVMCQAQHSMLLYSSSESMTFDFSPNPQDLDGNRIDKFASSPSNVIQAAPSRAKSSSEWTSSIVSTRSQELIMAISIITSIVMVRHLQTNH